MKRQEGELVDHYRIIHELGLGGMSQVYLARDEKRDRDVTLKFPNDELMGDPANYERFKREVKIGAILNHPNIQKLYEVAGGPQNPYLVMEYVPGETLRDEFGAFKSYRPEQEKAETLARSLGKQIGNALAYTHANGVFHRDLKPENVILTPDGIAKVMDFGIAFLEGSRRVTWGQLSSQVGTPDYMAPEQIKGQRGNDRTDIYALGMMLYELVAGRLPYQGDNALAVMNQHVTVSPPPPHTFRKQVTPALEEVILKAIRRNPESRWRSAQAFVAALDDLNAVDSEALKAERERDESDTGGLRPNDDGSAKMVWKAIGIAAAVLVSLVVLTFVLQALGHASQIPGR